MLKEIAQLSESKRMALFFKILGIDRVVMDDIKRLVAESISPSVDESRLNQLTTLLLSAVYLSNHFATDIWIEFWYALFVNLFLMGHHNAENKVPKFLDLGFKDQDKLRVALQPFDKVPNRRANSYQPRVVHLYSAFQNCLKNVRFLAQILDLSDVFHTNQFICGLQGTFVYNLAGKSLKDTTSYAKVI